MTPSSEETVKRYRLSYAHGVVEDRGDACHHPATTSQPMVLASAYDTVVAERDKWKSDWEAMMLMPFAKNFSAVEGERDRLREENKSLRSQLAAAAYHILDRR